MRLSYLKWLFLVCAVTYGLAISKVSQLPKSSEIKVPLSEDPVQQIIRGKEPFTLDYRSSNYSVEPVANYEISGMIVSHNDIGSFDDIYHTSDSVDVRDLCLIWGQNIEDDNHLSFDFKNEPFSCHINQKDYNSPGEFRIENLSNNHLLVSSEKIREQIYTLNPGDQVRLKGMLVNYSASGSDFTRRSSLVRTDDGNGACEVMLVEELQVLGRWKPDWWRVRTISAKASLILGILTLLSWIFGPIWEYEKRKRETNIMVANYRKRMGGGQSN